MKFKPDVVPVHCDVVLTAGLRVLVSWEGSSLVKLACSPDNSFIQYS